MAQHFGKRPPQPLKKLAEMAAGCSKLCPQRMDIQIAVLCDAATDNNGKLNILGTFDTIYTSQLPAIHPQCSIALRMTFSKVEEGAHKVKLNFVDEDGHSVMPPIEIPIEVQVPDETIFLSRNFIVNIQKLKFEKEGLYSIDIAVDGRQEGNIPLLVKVPPAAPSPHSS
jgi:Family of unknown function (DUF6941)